MFLYSLLITIIIALPESGFTQVINKGDNVEVEKGTRLCSNLQLEKAKGAVYPGRVFWKVTSSMRANGTQTAAAFIREKVYDSKSGDTKMKESLYQDDYATFFRRDPKHTGMLLMVDPQHGRVEAIVERCGK
jgi:hypothetical protein